MLHIRQLPKRRVHNLLDGFQTLGNRKVGELDLSILGVDLVKLCGLERIMDIVGLSRVSAGFWVMAYVLTR